MVAAPSSSKPPVPTLKLGSNLGPYNLVKLIAVGGMAEVYLARTKGVAGFEKLLALKVIHPDYVDDRRFVQMLVDEAKLAVKLNHVNIAQTFDLGKIGKIYFISMEYVDGADFFKILRTLTERDVELPVEAALFVLREVCSGLDYAHHKTDSQGNALQIIHRDVSPQNVLLSRHGEVKLVDFGIAKAANVSTKTRAGVIKGKLVYMSPEQAWGERVDQRCDIFSGGIVLYEALTGGSLYLEQNPVKLLEMVRKAEIKPPSALRPDLAPEVDALVMKALARDPNERFQNAREYGRALNELLHKIAPNYSAAQLGALVAAVLDEGPGPMGARKAQRPDTMERDDFAVGAHSVIFSTDDVEKAAAGDLGVGGPSRLPKARLLLFTDEGPQAHEVGEQFIIGRSGDLRLADGRVSRRHARIVLHEDNYLLEDLKSSNGTFLNDQKVEQIQRLNSGDVIRIGPFEMRFSIPDPLPLPEVIHEDDSAPGLDSALEITDGPDADSVLEEEEVPRSKIGAPTPSVNVMPADFPEEDLTANQPQAVVKVTIGDEQLVLPVERNFPLDHCMAVESSEIGGVGSTLVRRPDGYWLHPNPNRAPVFLDGRPVKSETQLHGGETLTVGPLEVKFELD